MFPKDRKSLAERTAEELFAKDHVGAVRHLEGADLMSVISVIRGVMKSFCQDFRDAVEELRGRLVYTCVADSRSGEMKVWVTATQVEGVGVVMDVKLFHQTEASAEADELLADMMGEIESRVYGHD